MDSPMDDQCIVDCNLKTDNPESCETNLNEMESERERKYREFKENCIFERDNPVLQSATKYSSEESDPENDDRLFIDECIPETDNPDPVVQSAMNQSCEDSGPAHKEQQYTEDCIPETNNVAIQSPTTHSFEECGPKNENRQCLEHGILKIDKPVVVCTTKHSLKEQSPCNDVVTLLELSKSSWARSPIAQKDVQPYLRGCKWSPDGTCCLAVVNTDGMHVCELSRDLYADSPADDRIVDVLDSVIHVKEAGLVYDFCWFPLMDSNYAESCCWITSLQNSPIQMWDAFDGSLRCTYRGFNAVDEMEPAISVIFTPDGGKIIAGYKNVLRTFDVNSPGRNCAEHKITSPASCLAVHMDILAVGSWNTSVSLYNINETGTYKSIAKIHGHSGGVTHMQFSPNGLYLVTGGRNDSKLLAWDVRFYRRPLNIFSRHVDTNQRIYFDISPCGRKLASGGTDGVVKIWEDWYTNHSLNDDDNAMKYPLHNDCCNSLSYHPVRPIIATGSGQFHFEDPLGSDNSDDSGLSDGYLDLTAPHKDHKYLPVSENNLTFWWIGDSSLI